MNETVPCPHCGKRIPLVFRQLRWISVPYETKEDLIERIKSECVWYECQECGGRIEENERDDMICEGTCIGLYRIDWRDIVVEFLEAKSDIILMRAFLTETLGVPWDEMLEPGSSDKRIRFSRGVKRISQG